MVKTLSATVLEEVSSLAYYQEKYPDWDGNSNSNVVCPFLEDHKNGTDNKPSFSLNIGKSGGCFCHGCAKKIGTIIHFEKLTTKEKIDDETAASRIYGRLVRPVICAPGEVEATLFPFVAALKSAPKVFTSLQNELSISPATIDKFDLGWDSKQRRISIPIFDAFNQLVNARYYRLPSMRDDPNFPKFLNEDGYGKPASLFPAPQITATGKSKHRPPVIYWFTGERDTLLAWDRGIPSFCYTTGENVCRKEWLEEIKSLGTCIAIVEDNDDAGREGAKKRHLMLEAGGVPSFIVTLPEEAEGVKDFSDYLDPKKGKGTVVDFLKLTHTNVETQPERSREETEGEGSPESREEFYTIPKIVDPTKEESQGEVAVSDIGRRPDLLNKPVLVKGIVSGKMDRTYSIPNMFLVGGKIYNLPISRELLQLIREKDESIIRMVQGWLHTKAIVKVAGHLTVTEVEIIPMVQPGQDAMYVNQRCYYFGARIECNKPYAMTLIPTTEMRNQETIGMITNIEPVSNILDSYKFDVKVAKFLAEEFQASEGDDLVENLRVLSHSIAENFTGILNRDDLHLVSLLTWLSPLQFEFPYEGLQRGWINTLVLGDTETGKSKVCQGICQLLQCGVFINAESCSYVGLVGGAVKSSSGMFLLRWGKIPLYNRQLVVVEELSGLSIEEISYMSAVRSEGIARYDKAGLTGETSAKTRLICLSNVRGAGRSLQDYNTGVQAAQGLIGQNEDLARFDLALTVTDDEVDGNIINKDRSQTKLKAFSTLELDAFKQLAMFAWTLKPEQIDFTLEAYRACLTNTLSMCKEYHSSLPIFKHGSGRLKLARVALAIACLQFAWDAKEKKLIVSAKHVNAAASVLNALYRKPSFGYARYSKIQYTLQLVVNEPAVISRIKEVFKNNTPDFYVFVSQACEFTKFDISESMNVNAFFVERVISQMYLSNLIAKGEKNAGWKLSRAGRKWVESQIKQKI